jgi:phage terminase large subunit
LRFLCTDDGGCRPEAQSYGNRAGGLHDKAITDPAVDGVPVHTGWDIGHHDYTSIWFWQRLVGRARIVGYFQDNGEGMPYYANVVRELYARNGWMRASAVDYVPHDARQTHTPGAQRARR